MLKKISLMILSIYILLMIPDCDHRLVNRADSAEFLWKSDPLWSKLETEFSEAKKWSHQSLDSIIGIKSLQIETELYQISSTQIKPSSELLERYLGHVFDLSPYIAASPEHQKWFNSILIQSRNSIKKQIVRWDINDRDLTYKFLYGLRAAMEEIQLLSPMMSIEESLDQNDLYSATPSTEILGIKVHSGDILVSRGTVEVSAFISRGNDYPGNFSHVALVHVDEQTNEASFIEAHIEKGVAIATLDQYLSDRKFRFMVLRMNPEHPRLKVDSLLPHHVASWMLNKVKSTHIPYDFKMNYKDSSEMFCSEVVSSAYANFGINLWSNLSTISSPGTAQWLSEFGVENFETQMPSDLEYDPKLLIVGEWYDKISLFDDHIYNAVMDVLLEEANNGLDLEYSSFVLPIARLVKGLSWVQYQFGSDGIIPKGMSATQAMKNNVLTELHSEIRLKTIKSVNEFIDKNDYRPPYWKLIEIAKSNSQK